MAKRTKIAALTASLRTATVTERVAIRAQRAAILVELQAARLTRAQRVAIHSQTSAMRTALWARPTPARKKALRAAVARLSVQLHCRTALTSVPPVAGV